MNETDRLFITDLYRGFLGREPDEAGLAYWGARLLAAKQNGYGSLMAEIEAVLDLFYGSAEFGARVHALLAGVVDPAPAEDVDIRGNPIPSPSGPPGATMGEQPGNPPFPGNGGGPCGAYQIPAGSCANGLPVTAAWLYVLEDGLVGRLGNSIRVSVPRDHAMIFRFRTAKDYPEFAAGKPRYLTIGFEENTVRGPLAPRFVSLSKRPGDFDYTKVEKVGGYRAMMGGDSLLAQITPTGNDPNVGFPYAQLKPDTTYYLNIRYEDPIGKPGQFSTTAPHVGQAVGFN